MRRMTFLAIGIIVCLISACHNKPAKAPKRQASSANNVWLGHWDRHEWQNGGELVILNVINDSIAFKLQVNGGGATGELKGKARIKADSAIFVSTENGDSCRMVFRLDKNRSAIAINSVGCYGYVGIGAYFEGKYTSFKGKEDSWNDTTQTLVSLEVLNRKEDNVFRKLVGRYYDTYINNTQLMEEDLEDEDKLNAKVIASSVNQMRTYMEYIAMIDSSKQIWTAVIDNDTVRYFTNSDLFKDQLPKTIDNWREKFKDYPVIYESKK